MPPSTPISFIRLGDRSLGLDFKLYIPGIREIDDCLDWFHIHRLEFTLRHNYKHSHLQRVPVIKAFRLAVLCCKILIKKQIRISRYLQ